MALVETRAFAQARALEDDRLRRAERDNAALSAALDRSASAIFLLDGAGRLRHANRQAEQLLAEPGFGVGLRHGRLTLEDGRQAERLDGLVAAAVAAGRGAPMAGAMTFLSGRRQAPVALRVEPLPVAPPPTGPGDVDAQDDRVMAMVRLTDPALKVGLSMDQLKELFAFTHAEARVALMLFEGLAPGAIAERLGVRLQTVRNQMRALFDKAGVARQVDLVRMLIALAG